MSSSEKQAISPHEIHVWVLRYTPGSLIEQKFGDSISQDERSRAARLISQPLQERFLANRAFLRDVLSRYLGVEAKQVEFCYGDRGKPELVSHLQAAKGQIRFNLSHSGEISLCAVALDRDVGVDIEKHRQLPNIIEIAERFFSSPEIAVLKAATDEQISEVFFRIWSGKEAFIKATGEGVLAGLASFAVVFGENGSAEIHRKTSGASPGFECDSSWSVLYIESFPGYSGAVATCRRDIDVAVSLEDWKFDEI